MDKYEIQVTLILLPLAMLAIKSVLHYFYYKALVAETGTYSPLLPHTDEEFGVPMWQRETMRTRRKMTEKDYLFAECLIPWLKPQSPDKTSRKSSRLKNLTLLSIILF